MFIKYLEGFPMSLRRLSLFALSLAALPMAAQAQDQGITGARILACEADRTGENCATLLSQLYVCKEAEEMAGCAELLALRDAAVDLSEREGALNGDEQDGEDDDGAGNEAPEGEAGAEDGIVTQPEGAEHIEVEVRAEGELADELACPCHACRAADVVLGTLRDQLLCESPQALSRSQGWH